MQNVIIDTIGWSGTALYLVAYGLVSAKKVAGDSWAYQGMNLIAGTFLIIYTLYLKAYPSVGLNVAWVGIAIFTIGNKWWNKK